MKVFLCKETIKTPVFTQVNASNRDELHSELAAEMHSETASEPVLEMMDETAVESGERSYHFHFGARSRPPATPAG